MVEVNINDEDIREFIDLKSDSAYAIAELYALKYLKMKFKDKSIFEKKPFDFIVYGTIDWKPVIVEVKFNHLHLSYEQVRTYYLKYYPDYRLWIITNKEMKKQNYIKVSPFAPEFTDKQSFKLYLKMVDKYRTPIGNFYCFEVVRIIEVR